MYNKDMYDLGTIKENLQKVVTWLKGEYASVHTGQASPVILDSIKIESYGSFQPIKNVASIQMEDPRTLRVNPWDQSHVSLIDKAIVAADLGLSVSVDGNGMRVHFPQLTEETRARIVKALKQKLEDARVSVRKERESAIKDIEAQDLPEDTERNLKESLQKFVDDTNRQLEEVFKAKEENTMKV
jgi:ribosome recycling factor